MRARVAVLVIAGSDSSGGAGLARDLRVLADCGLEALCAVTAVTAQSDSRLLAVHHVPPELIDAQIRGALATERVAAIKIGMLGTRATVSAVAEALEQARSLPLVLDPVLLSSSGGVLLDGPGRGEMLRRLLPRAALLTPNIPEAAALSGESGGEEPGARLALARKLIALGARAVLLKGGHAEGAQALDLLLSADDRAEWLAAPRLPCERRGTGCALATAIAASLARGSTLAQACRSAKDYVHRMLLESV